MDGAVHLWRAHLSPGSLGYDLGKFVADAVSRALGGPETSAPEWDDHAEPATTVPTPTPPATTSPATTRPAATQRFR